MAAGWLWIMADGKFFAPCHRLKTLVRKGFCGGRIKIPLFRKELINRPWPIRLG
jgi:hypothetical protein